MQTLSNPAEEFLVWVQDTCGRGASTIRSYRSDIKSFETWLEQDNGDASNPTLEDARRYLDERLATDLMSSTVERSAVTLRRYFLFRGKPEARRVLQRVTRPESYLRAANETAVIDALECLPSTSPSEKRNKAMLEVLYSCALRVRDLITLSLDDVERNAIVISGQRRPLGTPASKALAAWLNSQGRSLLARHHGVELDPTRVFVNNAGSQFTRQGVNYVAIRASGLMPYVFRDSCAQHMIDHDAPIDAVRTLLGVSAVDQRYRVDFGALRRVHRTCHPRG